MQSQNQQTVRNIHKPTEGGPNGRPESAAGSPRSARPDKRAHNRSGFEVAFWIVLFAYLAVAALGTVPSPLYGLYQQRDGFSTFTITLIFAAYSAGTVLSLFLAGSLSDLYGRKTVLIPAVLVGTVGAAVFLVWRDLPGLYVGRFLSGLSIGAVSAAATAYETELHIKSRPGG
jgi:MFS family permease